MAAHISATRKYTKFKTKCEMANYGFLPIIMETQGLWHSDTKSFIQDTIKSHETASKIPYSILYNYWARRISVTLQRALANAVLHKKNTIIKKQCSNSPNQNFTLNDEIILMHGYASVSGLRDTMSSEPQFIT
jgi:hypothetical protein